MNDFIKEREFEKATGLTTLDYTFPTSKGLLNFVGYFIVERFKVPTRLNLDYRLTQVFDVIEYIERGSTSNSKIFFFEGSETLLVSGEPITLLPEYIVEE